MNINSIASFLTQSILDQVDSNKSLDDLVSTSSSTVNSGFEFVDPFDNGKPDLDGLDSKLSEVEEKCIIMLFLLVIILGFFGNILVIWTVVFNKHMRTTSNLFILNLAISDLTLCIFSIPFNAYKTLKHSWVFGLFLCKFAPFFQATNVFVSTMSITAIALDRYVSIVCAVRIRQKSGTHGPVLVIIFIWLFAFLLSSPLFLFNTMNSMRLDFNEFAVTNPILGGPGVTYQVNYTTHMDMPENLVTAEALRRSSIAPVFDSGSGSRHMASAGFELDANELNKLIVTIDHCIESSPFMSSRLIYSYASLIIQYTLPILIVGIAYSSIWWKLKSHRNKLKSHSHQATAMSASTKRAVYSKHKAAASAAARKGANSVVINQNERQAQANDSLLAVPTSNTPMKRINSNLSMNSDQVNHATSSAKTLDRHNNAAKNFENRRRLKMNVLLTFIAIIFAASWLPLNLFNILSDSKISVIKPGSTYYIINAVCIMLGMSSAVSNPFLYGFLNENFKREYKKLFESVSRRLFGRKKTESPTVTVAMSKKAKVNAATKEIHLKDLNKQSAIILNSINNKNGRNIVKDEEVNEMVVIDKPNNGEHESQLLLEGSEGKLILMQV